MAERTFASLVPRVAASVYGCPHPTIINYIRDSAIRTCERTLLWRHQVPLFNLQPGIHEYFYSKPINTDVHTVFEAVVNCSPLERLTLEQAIEKYPCWADLLSGVPIEQIWMDNAGNQFNTTSFNGNNIPIPVVCPSTFGGQFGIINYNQNQYNSNTSSQSNISCSSPYQQVGCSASLYNGDGCGVVIPPEALEQASTPRSFTQITPDRYIILPLPDNERVYRMRMFVALKPKHNATGMEEFIFNELEELIMHGALQHLLVLPNQSWSDRELAAYHAKQYVFQTAERRARANLTNARGMLRVRMQPFGA